VDIALIVLVVLAVVMLGLVVWMGMPRGPSLEKVVHLKTPQILEMGPQKVLLVRAKGDPNQVGRKAFGFLMKTYFGLKGVPKGGPDFKPPRARWPVEAEIPMEEWEGLYAMPVPETVTHVGGARGGSGLSVELATWEYGEVAQILHVGRYDGETSTVEALHGFIRSQGYVIDGPHEEEYLRGPGLLLPGNPDKYLTIIRYPVKKMFGGTGS
jgi:hypothetical protein